MASGRGLWELVSGSLDEGRTGGKRTRTFTFEDEASFAEMVNWLENRVIRHLTEEERSGLQTYGPEWRVAFHAYIDALGCPHRPPLESGGADAVHRQLCTRWLLAHAVALVYEDKCASLRRSRIACGVYVCSYVHHSLHSPYASTHPHARLQLRRSTAL